MSGAGAPRVDLGDMSSFKVTVVASSWHSKVMDGLLEGALRRLAEVGIGSPRVVRVPGAFELPLAAQTAAASSDAVVALGVVIRGGTPHFGYVCGAATDGLMQASLTTGTPIALGLLTCDNEQQALDRAGLAESSEDKGAEAAEAALAMAQALTTLVVPTGFTNLDR